VRPTYLTGSKPVKVPLHSVMHVMRAIDQLGHSDEFSKKAARREVNVTISPRTVNFVKKYLVDNALHTRSAVAAKVVNPCPPGVDPFHCPHIHD
jgi:hypothetical protein